MKTYSWLEIKNCGTKGCARKVTRVEFLNTPKDFVYIVGACSHCKCAMESMGLKTFLKKLGQIEKYDIPKTALPYIVAFSIDPSWKVR